MSTFRRSCGTRWAVIAVAGAAMALAAAGPASAQQPGPPLHTITVLGTAQVKPTPRDRTSNASIAKAVADARAAAVPKAIADGNRRAASLAAAAGLPLGPLASISDVAGAFPFGFPGQGSEDGTFGPGRFCGFVRRSTVRVDANGRRTRVPGKRVRTCRIPAQIASSLTMVFTSG